MKIIIDPGHGGSETGATAYGLQEKDLNLTYAAKLADCLQSLGYEVDRSVLNDVEYNPTELTDLINWSGATLCLSCHNNAFNGQARGFEAIHSIHTDGTLANQILYEISTTGFPVRNAYTRESGSYPGSDYYFIIRMTYPTVETLILEFGFMDNPEDYNIITDGGWQDQFVNAISRAVQRCYPIANGAPAETPVETPKSPPTPHWAKGEHDELLASGILKSDHSDILERPASEGMVIALVNRLRKAFLGQCPDQGQK